MERRTKAEELGFVAYRQLDAALDWGADAIVIATPHDSHMRLARAMTGSCRVLLVEKPFGVDRAEMVCLLKEARQSGTGVFGVCNMRYHPAVKVLADHVGAVGDPLFARAHYGNYLPDMRPGIDYRTLYAATGGLGGALLDGVHEIDLVQWLMGTATVRHADVLRLGTLDIDSNDYAALSLEHRAGTRSEIHIDYLRRIKMRGLEVTGHDGTITWESVGKRPECARVLMRTATDGQTRTLYESTDIDGNAAYKEMLADVGAALEGEAQRLQTGMEAMQVADLVLPYLHQVQRA